MNRYKVNGLFGFGPFELEGPCEPNGSLDLFKLAPVIIQPEDVSSRNSMVCQDLASRSIAIQDMKAGVIEFIRFGYNDPNFAIWVARNLNERYTPQLRAYIKAEVLKILTDDVFKGIDIAISGLQYNKKKDEFVPFNRLVSRETACKSGLQVENVKHVWVQEPPTFSIHWSISR